MPPAFRHVLITRFNAPRGKRPNPKRLDEAWLEQRLDLFDRWCVPSVHSQDAEFDWVLFVDEQTPAHVLRRMQAAGARTLAVAPGWKGGRELVKHGMADRPWLISSRLDSDDAIAVGHLSLVQRQFREQRRRAMVRFPRGIQVRNGTVYSWTFAANPFFSLIERTDMPDKRVRSAVTFHHTRAPGWLRRETVWTKPQWLQVLHDDNLRNDVHGIVRLRGMRGLDFAVDIGPSTETWRDKLQGSKAGVRWAVDHPQVVEMARGAASRLSRRS